MCQGIFSEGCWVAWSVIQGVPLNFELQVHHASPGAPVTVGRRRTWLRDIIAAQAWGLDRSDHGHWIWTLGINRGVWIYPRVIRAHDARAVGEFFIPKEDTLAGPGNVSVRGVPGIVVIRIE